MWNVFYSRFEYTLFIRVSRTMSDGFTGLGWRVCKLFFSLRCKMTVWSPAGNGFVYLSMTLFLDIWLVLALCILSSSLLHSCHCFIDVLLHFCSQVFLNQICIKTSFLSKSSWPVLIRLAGFVLWVIWCWSSQRFSTSVMMVGRQVPHCGGSDF